MRLTGRAVIATMAAVLAVACGSDEASALDQGEAGVKYAPAGYAPLVTPLLGIKAERRRVPRGSAAFIVVWISPCNGMQGKLVRLLRNGRPNGSKYLNRVCTARFRPRVRRGTTFAAELVPETEADQSAASRWLRIKVERRRRLGRGL